jgi:hypothetical protein
MRPAIKETLEMDDEQVTGVVDIVERIMTQHWDLAACQCWVCQSGREFGCRPRDAFLRNNYPRVHIEWVDAL